MQSQPFKLSLPKQRLTIIGVSITLAITGFSMMWSSQESFILGLFFGLLVALGLTNFFTYLYTQSFRFLIYSSLILFWGLTLASFYELGDKHIWSDIGWLRLHSLGLFLTLSLCLSLLFSYFLLNVARYSQLLSLLFKLMAILVLINFVASFFLADGTISLALLSTLILTKLLLVFTGGWLWKKRVPLAKNYTISWLILSVGICLICLPHIANLHISETILLLALVIKSSLLTMMLILHYHQEKQSILREKVDTLEQLNQSYQAQTAQQNEEQTSTHDLEYKVQERTLELEIALRELSEKNQELEQRNTLDALTGIRNRSYFDKKYQAETRRSRREQTKLSIVMLDIDHFKNVNDQHGHLVGDECIKTVAQTIQNALKRPSDDVCRYGGEEFALILPNTELAGAMNLVEQIRLDIANTPINIDDLNVKITVSAGIATAIAEQDEDSILALADKQLYKAKNSGRNKVLGSELSSS
ncbi:diguanylate cyclase [Paraglaciecola aquimarina]|uniref:diguanylate cyclase n=1 Tax=Paraglaciecola algarum TaxID=3050085 RepID=A0ABS9D8M1_9ALTE|nr:diguanylate cyclase [Paraglaciecola sp. G1-23]MCF2949221.1 diguanylate cyclase [Paraglaciecola sp. G1-23]